LDEFDNQVVDWPRIDVAAVDHETDPRDVVTARREFQNVEFAR
jgi:hypothetical protein